MDKYYTPTIEDFCSDFEYEIELLDKEGNHIRWDKTTGAGGMVSNRLSWDYTNKCLEGDRIRIKYLDKEDIESLGFKCNYTDQYWKGDYIVLIDDDNFLQVIKEYLDEEIYLFQGIIKNKSELKRLLKQLNIE